MQFRFLGWQDCPEWLLAQICEFSSLSSVKFKGLCQLSVEFLLKKNVADEETARFVSEHNEHSKMLARVFASNLDVLKQYVKNSIPKEPPLESVTISEEDPSTPVLRYTRNGKTTVCQLTGEQLSAMRSDMDFVWDNIKVKFRDW